MAGWSDRGDLPLDASEIIGPVRSALEEGRRQGRIEEAQKLLLRLGERRFGPPDTVFRAWIDGIVAVEPLEALIERVLEVSSWQELLVGDIQLLPDEERG